MERKTTWIIGRIFCILLLTILIVIGLFLLYFAFHPYNRVEVSISDIPRGTHFLSLVAETDGTVESMNWFSGMFSLSEMRPDDCVVSVRRKKVLYQLSPA
jgi:hypothetical protein